MKMMQEANGDAEPQTTDTEKSRQTCATAP